MKIRSKIKYLSFKLCTRLMEIRIHVKKTLILLFIIEEVRKLSLLRSLTNLKLSSDLEFIYFLRIKEKNYQLIKPKTNKNFKVHSIKETKQNLEIQTKIQQRVFQNPF
jgi:hypothetical protein